MKLRELKLKNFRGYREQITLSIDDLTVLIGRNDAGKSSLLDALDIFFNDAAISPEDACVNGDPLDVRICCTFSELPEEVVLDEQHPSSLQNEYLVREDGLFEVCKVYNCSVAKPKIARIFAAARHPSTPGTEDLLGLKINLLKARAQELGVSFEGVNQTIKTEIRQAIWSRTADLEIACSEVDLTTETGKIVWDRIQERLPVFALFKSDRPSTDQDGEAQDPMKAAIKEAVRGHEAQLNDLISTVKLELEAVARKTVEKIQEMSPDLAASLTPTVKNKAWDSLFTVSLAGDEGISINKRGSGTRRLVLLNFFRAKAEDASQSKGTGTIYAIEEPETSQHPNYQLMLLEAFSELTRQGIAQVLLTTHTPTLARKVDRNLLRFIDRENGRPVIREGCHDDTLQAIKSTLGVLPDHDVLVFVGVEGKWDIEFLKRVATIFRQVDPTIPDLADAEARGLLVFIPLGGSSMELWTSRIANLNRPEVYITDRDNAPPANPKYDAQISLWNARPGCQAFCTGKKELENYLHPDAIRSEVPSFQAPVGDFDDVPLLVAEAIHRADPTAPDWAQVTPEKRAGKASRVKRRLNRECVDAMTPQLFQTSDAKGELISWLRAIASHLQA